jgi:hypothetical protein
VQRREIWQAYYQALSDVLQQARSVPSFLPTEPPSPAFAASPIRPTMPDPLSRFQQRVEVQRVQTTYEALLLKEVAFPKANERSDEVDGWIEAVMGNWTTFCGSMWREEELGDGGREGMTRSVLDILYRAATKSFHSTPILRHLFTVHLALGDFTLSFKALDTYLHMITKGKARVEQSGEPESGLDTDEIAIRTAGAGIKALCAFGERRHAQRAKEISELVKKWTAKHEATFFRAGSLSNGTLNPQDLRASQHAPRPVSLATVAGAHRAIGIALAHWARISFEALDQSDARFKLRTEALVELRKAVSQDYQDDDNLESLYALGLLLAEMRDTSGALAVVKQALTPQPAAVRSASVATLDPSSAVTPRHIDLPDPDRERKLLPLWHLLAMILSARQEFTTAGKACEAGLALVAGSDPMDFSFINGASNGNGGDFLSRGLPKETALLDQMNSIDREAPLQIKMTQMTLTEISEGPEVALESVEDLMSFFSKLFGDPSGELVPRPEARSNTMRPPKSSAGTIRNSIRGTILGRPKSNRASVHQNDAFKSATRPASSYTAVRNSKDAKDNTLPPEPKTPAIQVTDEETRTTLVARPEHQRFSLHHGEKQREKLQKRSTTSSLSHKKSVTSIARRKRDTVTSSVADTDDDDIVIVGNTPDHSRQSFASAVPVPEPQEPSATETWRASRQYRNSITPSQVGIAVTGDPDPLPTTTKATAAAEEPDEVAHEAGVAEAYRLPSSGYASGPFNPAEQPTARLSTGQHFTFPTPQLHRLEEKRLRVGLLVKVWLFIAGLYRRAKIFEDTRSAIDEASKLLLNLELNLREAASNDSMRLEELLNGTIGGLGRGSVEHLLGDLCAEVCTDHLCLLHAQGLLVRD